MEGGALPEEVEMAGVKLRRDAGHRIHRFGDPFDRKGETLWIIPRFLI